MPVIEKSAKSEEHSPESSRALAAAFTATMEKNGESNASRSVKIISAFGASPF